MVKLDNLYEGYTITCVLYQGSGLSLLEKLKEKGYLMASLYYARGKMIGEPIEYKSAISFQMPKEVVVVTCPLAEGEELFNWIFDEEKIGEPEKGFLYMTYISQTTPFTLVEEADPLLEKNNH